jgi:hypothetical protein
MAYAVQVAGRSPIAIYTSGTGVQVVGITRDGVNISQFGSFEDIPSDEYGGDNAPPAEVEYYGEIAVARLLLTKFDYTVFNAIYMRGVGTTAGVPMTPGTLMFAGGMTVGVIVQSTIGVPIYYPCCIVREPIEVNKGVKYSQAQFAFTAYVAPVPTGSNPLPLWTTTVPT